VVRVARPANHTISPCHIQVKDIRGKIVDSEKLDQLKKMRERREKGEVDEIEDTARTEINKRFGSGESDPGTGRQQTVPGSDSLRSDTNSNSLRRDVEIEDANPNAPRPKDAA